MSAFCPKLKVLLISPLPPPPGGIATCTATLVGESVNSHLVDIQVLDTAVRWRAVGNASALIRISGGSLQGLRDLWRTWRAVGKFKPDVLHLNTSAGYSTAKDVAILSMAKCHKVKTVIHYHMGRLPEIIEANTSEWRFLRFAMLKADWVVVLGKEAERAVNRGLKTPRAIAIPNPADISQIEDHVASDCTSDATGDVPHIVFVGHVVSKKGVAELIKACCQLESRDFVLDIVGPVNDKYKSELQSLAAGHKSGTWLLFHGAVDRSAALKFMAKSMCILLPSINNWEAFPMVIIEAMACGKPVIASSVGAIPEMLDVTGDPCGICVEPRDVDGLRDAIRMLLDDPEVRLSLAHRAQIRVQDYSSAKIFAELTRLWTDLAKNHIVEVD